MKVILMLVGLLVIIFAMSRIINGNGATNNKGSQLPDWLMRREKLRIAASLGRSGARYTVSIICAPRSVVSCTACF